METHQLDVRRLVAGRTDRTVGRGADPTTRPDASSPGARVRPWLA